MPRVLSSTEGSYKRMYAGYIDISFVGFLWFRASIVGTLLLVIDVDAHAASCRAAEHSIITVGLRSNCKKYTNNIYTL